MTQLVSYCEINDNYAGLGDTPEDPGNYGDLPWGTFSAWKEEETDNLWSNLNPICDNTFKKVMIGSADHIWPAFTYLFGGGAHE